MIEGLLHMVLSSQCQARARPLSTTTLFYFVRDDEDLQAPIKSDAELAPCFFFLCRLPSRLRLGLVQVPILHIPEWTTPLRSTIIDKHKESRSYFFKGGIMLT
jgi:hypothetical protein